MTEEKILNSAQVEWHDRVESFMILGAVFDVQAAKKMIRAQPREICYMPVEYFSFCSRWVATFWRIKVESDLGVPLILAVLGAGYLIIDGYHRLHRAEDKKVSELPTVRLTSSETTAILTLQNEDRKGKKKK